MTVRAHLDDHWVNVGWLLGRRGGYGAGGGAMEIVYNVELRLSEQKFRNYEITPCELTVNPSTTAIIITVWGQPIWV